MKEWIASDLSGLDLLVVQIDGIHMDEELILVAAIGVDAKGDKHPLAGAQPRWRCAGPQPLCGKQSKASDKAHKQLPALVPPWKRTRQETQPAACLLAKPTQLNINLSSGRFAIITVLNSSWSAERRAISKGLHRLVNDPELGSVWEQRGFMIIDRHSLRRKPR